MSNILQNINFRSYFNKKLNISVLFPDNWNISKNENFEIFTFDNEIDGFKANIGFSENRIQTSNPQEFNNKINEIKNFQYQNYKDFRRISEEKLFIDNYPAYKQIFEWNYVEEQKLLNHFFGLILHENNRLLEFNAVSLISNSQNYFELFDYILKSVRFIYN